jgi:hypothetical protein
MYYPDQIVSRKKDVSANSLLEKLLYIEPNNISYLPKKAPTQQFSPEKRPDEKCSCGCSTKETGCGCSNKKMQYPNMIGFPQVPQCLPSNTQRKDVPSKFPFPISAFENDPNLASAALYGRAVGGNEGCSIWNVGGPYIFTGGHCDDANRQRIGIWGRYGGNTWEPVKPSSWQAGQKNAIERWSDLGLPTRVDTNGNLYIDAHLQTPVQGFAGNTLVNDEIQTFETTFLDTSYSRSAQVLSPNPNQPTFVQSRPLAKTLREDQDVSVYRAKEKTWSYTDPLGELSQISLFPSNLYGTIPFSVYRSDDKQYYLPQKLINAAQQTINIAEGDRVYGLAINSFRGVCQPRGLYTYLSPSGRIKKLEYKLGLGSSFASSTRKLDLVIGDLFSYHGTSGSPLLQYATNQAIAVSSESLNDNFPCKENNYVHENCTSYYSLIPTEFLRYAPSIFQQDLPLNLNYISSKRRAETQFIGGKGGTQHPAFTCPKGYAAGGIISSTVHSNFRNRIGNFGLVCLPFFSPSFFRWNLSTATVNAAGSIDLSTLTNYQGINSHSLLDFRSARNVPFDIYTNEYLSSLNSNPRKERNIYNRFYTVTQVKELNQPSFQQDLTMCSPGFYLSGLLAITGTFERGLRLIESILAIKCESYKKNKSYWRIPRKTLGGEGLSLNPKIERIECPSGFVVDQAKLSSGWFLDEFQFGCKEKS